MNVNSVFSNDDNVLTVFIEGDFNFSLLDEFCNSYKSSKINSATKIIVDMRKTLTIDSSALGMLLNMQKHLNKADGEVNIINSNDMVRNIFTITRFDKKLNIL